MSISVIRTQLVHRINERRWRHLVYVSKLTSRYCKLFEHRSLASHFITTSQKGGGGPIEGVPVKKKKNNNNNNNNVLVCTNEDDPTFSMASVISPRVQRARAAAMPSSIRFPSAPEQQSVIACRLASAFPGCTQQDGRRSTHGTRTERAPNRYETKRARPRRCSRGRRETSFFLITKPKPFTITVT